MRLVLVVVAVVLLSSVAGAGASEHSTCIAGIGAASYPGNVEGTIAFLPKGCTP